MDASTWRRTSDIRKLLPTVLPRLGERKRMLFAAACCRSVEPLLDVELRALLERTEAYADGVGDRQGIQAAHAAAESRRQQIWQAYSGNLRSESNRAARERLRDRAFAARAAAALFGVAHDSRALQGLVELIDDLRPGIPTELLRDAVGNLLQPPALDPAWLTWNAGAVLRLARAIYDDRRFAELPLLADVLAEAGCAELAVLDHLRSPGPHARGCWVVDWLLRLHGASGPAPAPARFTTNAST